MSERANDTQERLQALRQLIREGEASTQEELCSALKRKKFDVTQSTVSRDLRRIGAVKATNGEGEIIYRLPEHHLAQLSRASHDVSQLVVEIRSNESVVVIHTTPRLGKFDCGRSGSNARNIGNFRNFVRRRHHFCCADIHEADFKSRTKN